VHTVDVWVPFDERAHEVVHDPTDLDVRLRTFDEAREHERVHDVADRAEAHDHEAIGGEQVGRGGGAHRGAHDRGSRPA
jgi:hypothetical protein